MSILIKGMKMPTVRDTLVLVKTNGTAIVYEDEAYVTTAAHVPPHGDLIERDKLRSTIYHEAFEIDTPMQRWDSGCWIRYKLFENNLESAPTIIPAEEGE